MSKANKACPYSKKCGGCAHQGKTYEQQLQIKQQKEQSLLGTFSKVLPIIGMENPYNYRNKVHAAFTKDKKGNIICGSYIQGTHQILDTAGCMIEDEVAGKVINAIKQLATDFGIKTYDEDRKTGILRHVLVRTGHKTGQVLVIIVLGTYVFPSKKNFIKELLKKCPYITSIVININDKKTSMILGNKQKAEYGKGYIVDELCGLSYRISPKSFYQVNAIQTEKLYKTAIEFAGLTGKETVLDAYSGIGTIGMTAAASCMKVISVESNKDAVFDARLNMKSNNITNIEIHVDDAGKYITSLARNRQTLDVVFMDPPRAGSDKPFLNALLTLKPKKIVYVSCNPETLARDLKHLTTNGYNAKKIQPVDMFPWTDGIETVVLLEYK